MNLLIGNTSQLSNYFPDDFIKISSRNINYKNLKNYDNVYILFAEQRTYDKSLTEDDFIDVNVNYTSKLVDNLYQVNKNIILYGTAELWNAHDGPIDIDSEIKYNYSPYIKSKEVLYHKILNKRESGKWLNTTILHPVNFNSTHRKKNFLFYKIFDSIINKNEITVGDLNIERDIIHPSYLADQSLVCSQDRIIGSGQVINIRKFIISLYKNYNMEYNYYVQENSEFKSPHKNNIFWSNQKEKYNDLLKDTLDDINKREN